MARSRLAPTVVILLISAILIGLWIYHRSTPDTVASKGTTSEAPDPVPTATQPIPSPASTSKSTATATEGEAADDDLRPEEYGGDPGIPEGDGDTEDNPNLPVGEPWFDEWEDTATRFGLAFIHTSQGQQEWEKSLQPLVSEHLADNYETTDIRNVPQASFESVTLLPAVSGDRVVWADIDYDTFSMRVCIIYEANSWTIDTVDPLTN